MTLETLNKANRVAADLRKWRDIENRITLENGFYQIKFEAYESKTMPDKYETQITDKATIEAFKIFVSSMIKKCTEEIEAM